MFPGSCRGRNGKAGLRECDRARSSSAPALPLVGPSARAAALVVGAERTHASQSLFMLCRLASRPDADWRRRVPAGGRPLCRRIPSSMSCSGLHLGDNFLPPVPRMKLPRLRSQCQRPCITHTPPRWAPAPRSPGLPSADPSSTPGLHAGPLSAQKNRRAGVVRQPCIVSGSISF